MDGGGMSDDEDMGGGRGKGSKLSTEAKRSQHCEVEKRRRERMNRYMNELAQMIPTCAAVPRRLDKLSILKMAVDHMKTLRGDGYIIHQPSVIKSWFAVFYCLD
jgi:aryl hydrocarbon receptor nuclear translocator-like protein 1